MPHWFYPLVFLLVLFIVFLFFARVNLIIYYDKKLKIYYKILFIKIPIYPFTKPAKSNKKKSKKKKGTSPNQLDEFQQIQNIIAEIDRYKELTKSIFSFYFRALHFKVINLDILIATKNAACTALTFSFVCQALTYISEYIKSFSKFEIKKDSQIYVRADFLKQKSHFRAHFLIYTHLAPLMAVGTYAFFKMIFSFIFSFIKRRIGNEWFKAKRAN